MTATFDSHLDYDPFPHLYEFLCTGCDSPTIQHLASAHMDLPRPICPRCNRTVVPNLAFFRECPGFKSADCTIFPSAAHSMIETAYISAKNEVSMDKVTDYADKMRNHGWTHATERMGGDFCPILLVQNRVLLGVQRLMAAVEANFTLINVIAEVD